MTWKMPEKPMVEAVYGGVRGLMAEGAAGRVPGIMRMESYLDRWLVGWTHETEEFYLGLSVSKIEGEINVVSIDPYMSAVYDFETGFLRFLRIGLGSILREGLFNFADYDLTRHDLDILQKFAIENKELVFNLVVNIEGSPCAYFFQDQKINGGVEKNYSNYPIDPIEINPGKGCIVTEIVPIRFKEKFWLKAEKDQITLGLKPDRDGDQVVGLPISRYVDFSQITRKIDWKERVDVYDLNRVMTDVSGSLRMF